MKRLSVIRMLLDNAEYCKSIRITRRNVASQPAIVRIDFLFQDECDTITWKFKMEEFDNHYKKYIPQEKIIQ